MSWAIRFAYAVVDIEIERRRACDNYGLALVRRLRELDASMRIVVTTHHDSFVSVILALRAGADDCQTACDFDPRSASNVDPLRMLSR
jgi:ActR/RegA family two-component response regulator